MNPLEKYGYWLADQDGYDGGWVSAIEHKEEEFFAALEIELDAKPIECRRDTVDLIKELKAGIL